MGKAARQDAAEKRGRLDHSEVLDVREVPKLPQARLYYNAALWGLDAMVTQRLQGYAYRFHMVGILSSLRTVQFALFNHDRKISALHAKAIDAWKAATPMTTPELAFIKDARDQILKGGAFESYATSSESGTGEGSNYTITATEYELSYYVDGGRRDLLADITKAMAWCDAALASIESQLPQQFAPDDD